MGKRTLGGMHPIQTVKVESFCLIAVDLRGRAARQISSHPDICCVSISDVGGPEVLLGVGLKVVKDFKDPVDGTRGRSVRAPRAQPRLGATQESMVQVGVQVGRRHGFPCFDCCC